MSITLKTKKALIYEFEGRGIHLHQRVGSGNRKAQWVVTVNHTRLCDTGRCFRLEYFFTPSSK